jgi:hypothetical protein
VIDIFEKCTEIVIKPGFKVDEKQRPTETHVAARASYRAKDGGIQHTQINTFAPTVEGALNKLRVYVEAWYGASDKIDQNP